MTFATGGVPHTGSRHLPLFNFLKHDFSVKYSSYLLLVHLMSFFLFGQQFQINDPHIAVLGPQRYSARMDDNNELHEVFLITFEEISYF